MEAYIKEQHIVEIEHFKSQKKYLTEALDLITNELEKLENITDEEFSYYADKSY